jgi:4'-phosphopantetheinyl transferase superfamily
MDADLVPITTPEGAPEVRLLDARAAGLDEPGLRDRARVISATVGAPYVSRSYRHPYALVSWHTGPVGIDLERVEPCDAAFARSICTPAETIEWATLEDASVYFSSLWCSKEALAKALGDALRYDARRLEAPMLWPAGRAGAWNAARLPMGPGHVAWLCWRSVTGLRLEPTTER